MTTELAAAAAEIEGKAMTITDEKLLEAIENSTFRVDEKWRDFTKKYGVNPALAIEAALAELEQLRAASQAVVDRWDSPKWKDLPNTGNYINALRKLLPTPLKPCPYAVEAMNEALAKSQSIEDFSYPAPVEVIKHLSAAGFTITRQPAMTDAELEREAMEFIRKWVSGKYTSQDDEAQAARDFVAAVKKYRG